MTDRSTPAVPPPPDLREAAGKPCSEGGPCIRQAELDQVHAENADLRQAVEQLKEYAVHKDSCEMTSPREGPGVLRFWINTPEGRRETVCTCGLDGLLSPAGSPGRSAEQEAK